MDDLARYRGRVHAAVSTGQCLDYAEDVSNLITEVERLRAGITAGWQFYEACYLRDMKGPHISDVETRNARAAHVTAERFWNVIHDEMGQGWRP